MKAKAGGNSSAAAQRAGLAVLLLAVLMMAGACAGGARTGAPIDFRTGLGGAGGGGSESAPAVRFPIIVPVADPASISSMPSVQEAAGQAPQTGTRPGGPLRQSRAGPEARALTVGRGDSLNSIARRHAVNMRALIDANRLSPPYELERGSTLYLPPANIHVVEPGETLYSIGRRFNVDTRSLAVMNRLERPWIVWPRDEILLPPLARDQWRGGTSVAADAPAAPRIRKAATPRKSAPATSAPQSPSATAAAAGPGAEYAANPAGKVSFIWPVTGRVLKRYGVDAAGVRNEGVNIDAGEGDPVVAAAAGAVVYAGAELEGLGNLILVEHSAGWVTAYAHSAEMLVTVGDKVRQGQVLARAGATGAVDRPQVHFQLRKGKAPVDPLLHLPGLKS